MRTPQHDHDGIENGDEESDKGQNGRQDDDEDYEDDKGVGVEGTRIKHEIMVLNPVDLTSLSTMDNCLKA